MADSIARSLLNTARTGRSDGGAQIWSTEMRPILEEMKKADPETGKPAGKYSQAALDMLSQLAERDLSEPGFAALQRGLAEARANLWAAGPAPGAVANIAPKHGHKVFLTPNAGFAVNTDGARPADAAALGNQLFHAGEWVQASFGGRDNLFATARLDNAGKNAVLSQFESTIGLDLRELQPQQKAQLLGNIAGLAVEMIKSVEINSRAAINPAEARAVITRSFNLLSKVLDDQRLGLDVKQMLVGYLQGSDSFLAQLEPAQRKEIGARHAAYNPESPFDYKKWDAIGKSVIRVDNIEGQGEGFLYGFVEWLKNRGLGDARWNNGANKFQVISGDGVSSETVLRATISKNDPINAWGRDMTVEIVASEFRNNMFRGLGKEDVDITGYNGHSGFGRNTLQSYSSMPEQKGDKMFYRFVCAGVDVENGIALRAPKAFANSYTTQDSGYFRTKDGPHGKYAYEAEGWEGIRALIRGALGKKTHKDIQGDLKAHANWPGHTPGNPNNFVGPGDARRGGSGDWDQDGIPNMFDVMPTVNTFNVAADTAREFELKVPNVPVDQIKGDRAFDAISFVNTATNYTTLLSRYNENRKLNAHPEGVWFEDKSSPPKYVKFTPAANGETYVQLNSALANMTIETLRAVMFYETSNYLLTKNSSPNARTQESRVAANLLFAASALEYDMSWRDDAVFTGIKKMYGIPASVPYDAFKNQMYSLADRHNYGGDSTALTAILGAHQAALATAGVGSPSIGIS